MALPAGKGQRRQLESQKNPKVQVHKARLERMEQKTGTEPGLHLSQAQWEPLGTGRGQPGVMALVGGPHSAGRAGQQRRPEEASRLGRSPSHRPSGSAPNRLKAALPHTAAQGPA